MDFHCEKTFTTLSFDEMTCREMAIGLESGVWLLESLKPPYPSEIDPKTVFWKRLLFPWGAPIEGAVK
ncbi:hypothetical protein [Thermococcus sp. P6]|uniref:hypothetical protein n=1 Tax=Thermococcus sp. P6 TaxID=122420 RepID=UPI0012FD1E08|nr:hypothetical protein [Thermococcus sp. P6]